jgi:hypothetical protein
MTKKTGLSGKEVAQKIMGYPGRMLSGSKGQYRWDNDDHLIAFNGNLFVSKSEKIWYGDMDITIEEENILKLAKKLGRSVYVLHEHDGRFEKEDKCDLSKAIYIAHADDRGEIGENQKEYYAKDASSGRIRSLPDPEPTEEEKAELKARKERTALSYKRKDFNLEIELGDINRFKSRKKKVSPYHNFWDWLMTHVRPVAEGEYINGFAVYMSEEDHQKLRDITREWIKKVVYRGMASDYRVESEMGWLSFAICVPTSFGEDSTPSWAKPGHVYIKEKELFRQETSKE